MKKKILLVLVLLAVSVGIAKAALPALVIPMIAETVEALVVRSVGRQAVVSLSTAAANDTTFAAAVTALRGTQLAAWLGFGAVTAAYPVNLDTPVAPVLAKEKYAVQIGNTGTDYKPSFVSPGYRMPLYDPNTGTETNVYGSTRELAIAALIDKWKITPGAVNKWGKPTGEWKIYSSPDAWANTTSQFYWSISVFTDSPYYKKENEWSTGAIVYVYVADPIEPRDGQRRILWDGKKFKADTDDPDWSEQDAKDFATQSSFGFVAKGSAGESLRVGISTDGTQVKVQEDVQGQTSDGKPQVLSRSLAIAPSGQAISTESSSKVGATLETDPANWSPGSDSNSGSGWPDDYARDATVQRVANAVEKSADGINKISDELTKKGDAADPDLPDMDHLKNIVVFKDVFKDLLSWELPIHKSECPIIEFKAEVAGFDLSPRIDAHCKMIDDQLRGTINLAFGVVYLVIAFFIVMGA